MFQIKQIYFETIDSTQDYLKNHLDQIEDVMIVRAGEQTKGRGQGANTWDSPKSSNIYVTFGFKLDKTHINILPYVPQTTIVTVAQSLPEGLNPKLKWVNDLLINGKKVCGVLCESVIENSLILLIGIGINVDSSSLSTSSNLESELNQKVDAELLFTRLKENLIQNIKQLQSGFQPFQAYFNNNLYGKGQPVTLHDTKMENIIAKGILEGITQEGHVKIRNSQQLIETYNNGRLTFD